MSRPTTPPIQFTIPELTYLLVLLSAHAPGGDVHVMRTESRERVNRSVTDKILDAECLRRAPTPPPGHPMSTEQTTEQIPRRIDHSQHTAAEEAITDAMQLVERAGCDVALTDAVVLLEAARTRVADFVDGVPGIRLLPREYIEPPVPSSSALAPERIAGPEFAQFLRQMASDTEAEKPENAAQLRIAAALLDAPPLSAVVSIKVNGRSYRVQDARLTGIHIKSLDGIPAQYQLFREGAALDSDWLVGDYDVENIVPDLSYYTVPPCLGG